MCWPVSGPQSGGAASDALVSMMAVSSMGQLAYPRQDLVLRPSHVDIEVDLRPRQIADVLVAELLEPRENEIPDRFFVFDRCSAGPDILVDPLGERCSRGGGEAKKSDG